MTRRYSDLRRPKPAWTFGDRVMVGVAALLPSALLAVGLLPFMLPAAQARYKPEYAKADPQIAEWFKNQHNSTGQWCCDEADGHRYYGDYKMNPDGSVTVEGQTIPKEQVLTGPNPTGSAVWWFVDTAAGRTTYCFAPGGGA